MACGGHLLSLHLNFAAFKPAVHVLDPSVELFPNDADGLVYFEEDLIYLFGRAHFVYVKASAAAEPQLGILNSLLRQRDALGPVLLLHVELVQIVSPFIVLQAHLLLQGSDFDFEIVFLALEFLCQLLADLVLTRDFLLLALLIFAVVPLSKALVPRVVTISMSRVSSVITPARTFLAARATTAPVAFLTRPGPGTTSLQTL
mmetsp:Transcript_32393/g.45167  ORF Transcript_32393/g.45167 Transcript_32393/m.45167 type:complete len:202 (-) Transcript_32393:73-678(-)